MHILVTGGAGFIGSHLVDRLISEGHFVTVLDDFSSGKVENLEGARRSGKLKIIKGSVLNQDAVNTATESVQVVFHLAVECVRKSIGNPLNNHEVNASGTLFTLEAARRHSVEKYVYCSSSEVYGSVSEQSLDELTALCAPVTVYGAAKLAGELYTLAYHRTYALPVVVVRPFNAYGPREHDRGDLAEVIPRFVIRVLNGLPPVIFGDGSQGRDFTYVGDTVEGLVKALFVDEIVGSTINIGRGRLVTIRDLAWSIIEACGADDLGVDYLAGRPGDVYRLIANTQLAKEKLNFSAKTSLKDGLKTYVSWFKNTYSDPTILLEKDLKNWDFPGG